MPYWRIDSLLGPHSVSYLVGAVVEGRYTYFDAYGILWAYIGRFSGQGQTVWEVNGYIDWLSGQGQTAWEVNGYIDSISYDDNRYAKHASWCMHMYMCMCAIKW